MRRGEQVGSGSSGVGGRRHCAGAGGRGGARKPRQERDAGGRRRRDCPHGAREREHGRPPGPWVELRGGVERERSVRGVRVGGGESGSARPEPRARRVRPRPWRSTTSRASISSSGAEANGPSEKPSISADGRVVVFPSTATNLVAADRNGFQDVSSAIARRERRSASASGRTGRRTDRASPRSSAPTDASSPTRRRPRTSWRAIGTAPSTCS